MSDEQEKYSEIALEGGTYETTLTKKFTQRKIFEKADPRVLKARIPGSIDRIETRVGSAVKQGDTLMILEAMKMHNRIKAPMDGTIKAIQVTTGQKVVKGQTLIEID